MPTAAEIFNGLTLISKDDGKIACQAHILVWVLLWYIFPHSRTIKRIDLAVLLWFLPLSVTGSAFVHKMPFNGIVFGALSLYLLIVAARMPRLTITYSSAVYIVIGSVMIVLGCVYPHFLNPPNPWVYLVGAPMGIIPCPTLFVLIGFYLIVSGFQSRLWSISLAAAGLFYGLFGAFRLGIYLDLALAVGAIALIFLLRSARFDAAVQAAAEPPPPAEKRHLPG
jgi:magnesium-transporting ATPase (P-type)